MKRTITTLMNHHIAVVVSAVPDEQATAEARMTDMQAEPVMQPFWDLVLTDRDTGDEIHVGMIRKGRDGLIKDLTGGVSMPTPAEAKRVILPGQ